MKEIAIMTMIVIGIVNSDSDSDIVVIVIDRTQDLKEIKSGHRTFSQSIPYIIKKPLKN